MPARALPLVLTTLLPLLAACATRPAPLAAALADAPDRRAAINAQLAPRCPTPGSLTPRELSALAGLLEAPGTPPAVTRLAGEYDRLDDEARLCRGVEKGH